MVKHLPAMQETPVRFLGWEDRLEKEVAIHSSTLAWKIPWMEESDMDQTEAEDIKKKQQEDTEELYKKYLHNSDNHNGVITHPEPDILECEVNWALESTTMNKASGGDGIPVDLFQILKDDAVNMPICQYASKFGKLSSGHRTGKGQFSFQFQRKEMPKNAQTTAQLHSSHMLVK